MDFEGQQNIDRNGGTDDNKENTISNSIAEGESEQANEVAHGSRCPDLVTALDIVEKDANEVAGSLTSLLSSLRLALSQVTSSSVDHMRCYNDVAGQMQESALDAASKGNRFINASLRLNDEMKGTGNLAAQLKSLRRTVDHLDSLVTRYLPRS